MAQRVITMTTADKLVQTEIRILSCIACFCVDQQSFRTCWDPGLYLRPCSSVESLVSDDCPVHSALRLISVIRNTLLPHHHHQLGYHHLFVCDLKAGWEAGVRLLTVLTQHTRWSSVWTLDELRRLWATCHSGQCSQTFSQSHWWWISSGHWH